MNLVSRSVCQSGRHCRASMMITFILCANVMAGAPIAFAEEATLEFAVGFGGSTSPDGINAIAVDANGNIYTTGVFVGTVDFDPGAGIDNRTSAGGSRDIFVQKLDANGNLVYVWTFGDTAVDFGTAITVDDSGNVYVGGSFRGTVDFDPGVGAANRTSTGEEDIFILKLDSAGDFSYVAAVQGVDQKRVSDLVLDNGGSVYATGYFSGSADFDPSVVVDTRTSAGGNDIYVLKLDAAGGLVFAQTMGGVDSDIGHGIALDSMGSIYTTGCFAGTADFDPGVGVENLSGTGLDNIYVQKLDSTGANVYARAMSGAGGENCGLAIAVDSAGNTYSVGHFSNTVDFDPGAGNANVTTNGFLDAYLLHLDASGNFSNVYTIGDLDADVARAIKIDSDGNILIAGDFASGTFNVNVDFDPSADTFLLTGNGTADAFFLKLDSGGDFVCAAALGGAQSDGASAIALGPMDEIHVAGEFRSTADFDPGAAVASLSSNGGSDAYIAKFSLFEPAPAMPMHGKWILLVIISALTFMVIRDTPILRRSASSDGKR